VEPQRLVVGPRQVGPEVRSDCEVRMIDRSMLVTISGSLVGSPCKEETRDLLFAYGANMNLQQIGSRCSRPVAVSIARLANHRLAFYGYNGVWDGALETAEPKVGSEVWGVLFALSRLDWERLDEWQGARMDGGGMYFHFPITVTDPSGRVFGARMYKKDVTGMAQNPSQEYLDHIVRGASENGLPSDYISALMKRKSRKASYSVPMRSGYNLAANAGLSCADCPTDVA